MMRVGMGFDAHAFSNEARALVLGGVAIPGFPGLAGHSDADVLSHAIADSLLGAAGLSDLGASFPNIERWRGASSLEILAEVARSLAEHDWSIGNVDATVIAERPRVAPHRADIVATVSRALSLDPSSVWVKATTTDGMGFTGRSEGIAALAVALVERR
jgi:2-C-methyl-D-erythritol 2,4-cyclodiphosphate synthase